MVSKKQSVCMKNIDDGGMKRSLRKELDGQNWTKTNIGQLYIFSHQHLPKSPMISDYTNVNFFHPMRT
jgi:hypothetical protein